MKSEEQHACLRSLRAFAFFYPNKFQFRMNISHINDAISQFLTLQMNHMHIARCAHPFSFNLIPFIKKRIKHWCLDAFISLLLFLCCSSFLSALYSNHFSEYDCWSEKTTCDPSMASPFLDFLFLNALLSVEYFSGTLVFSCVVFSVIGLEPN